MTDKDYKYTESFGWEVWGAYALFAASGFISIASFALVHYTTGKVDERVVLLITLMLNTVAWVTIFDF